MSQPSRTRVVALNAASNYARFAVNIVVWFFLTPTGSAAWVRMISGCGR